MPLSKSSDTKKNVSPRIREFQLKIQDQTYIDYAVERIALIVSRQIVEKRNTSAHSAEKLY